MSTAIASFLVLVVGVWEFIDDLFEGRQHCRHKFVLFVVPQVFVFMVALKLSGIAVPALVSTLPL